ncbi:hypothetical protein [Clostridium tagluense]|uniref:Uncharacterized protein n=1 Tax=Clostridium tagluense TaxID=360422 RepID=A0A401USP4_9CLOT|nr:hypothetical protein [Clostridium tagluense]GCD12579.1 hypothetical protein Ctaglu_42020 [Clostridium tagluense]
MKVARNINGLIVNITNSVPNMEYKCPVCGDSLTRNFGVLKQYFSHFKGTGEECELKYKIFENGESNLKDSDLDILKREYYDKKFEGISTELSDYKSDEGFFLTEQQKSIINSTEDKIVVSALAGSSKTTTMYYYCKARPCKEFLYLVYNSSMKKEADMTFGKLRNVEVRTIHSLAYKYVGAFYKDKLTFNYGAIDIIKDLGMRWTDQEIAIKVGLMMKEYMLSNVMFLAS